MLGEDRGPVLEVIVSRTNFISSHTSQKVRVVGLSTALANARDLADWLGISQVGENRGGGWGGGSVEDGEEMGGGRGEEEAWVGGEGGEEGRGGKAGGGMEWERREGMGGYGGKRNWRGSGNVGTSGVVVVRRK